MNNSIVIRPDDDWDYFFVDIDFYFPYPVRSISWHPKQHVLAVATQGERAAVIIYVGSKEE